VVSILSYQHLACLRAVQVPRQLDPECLLQARHHGDAAPGAAEVNLDGGLVRAVGMVLDLVGTLQWSQCVEQQERLHCAGKQVYSS
jgi:hypothetical protein